MNTISLNQEWLDIIYPVISMLLVGPNLSICGLDSLFIPSTNTLSFFLHKASWLLQDFLRWISFQSVMQIMFLSLP
jgi:hypothetical protein